MGITSRQREVVELIAQGLSNEEVGLVLGISECLHRRRRYCRPLHGTIGQRAYFRR